MKVLGIDTGGTYTDGVLLDRTSGCILKSVKTLTTPWDLIECLKNCLEGFEEGELKSAELICLSTTLATNAILEGRGGKAGLVLMGSVPDGKLPVDEYVYLPAKMDIRGGVKVSLIPEKAKNALRAVKGKYEALAISGYSSVRNPAHEEELRGLAQETLGIPVVCAHELTGELGFYERTVTAVLNAKLLPVIAGLVNALEKTLAEKGVTAPVMVVRGDGSFMKSDYAMSRPVETILSGPAASMLGAAFLSGNMSGLVADMGGTSLDIVKIDDGSGVISENGAEVGGWRTRVRALDIRTYAVGGDSEITMDEERRIFIGPRKVIPMCRKDYMPGKTGLTPTDVAHVTGEFVRWDREASAAGMEKFARKLGADGGYVSEILSESITDLIVRDIKESESKFETPEDIPVIGVGAPAKVWINKAGKKMKRKIFIPDYAHVANAVGAAAAKIMEMSSARVRFDRRSESYIVYSEENAVKFENYHDAAAAAEKLAVKYAMAKAKKAGADAAKAELFRETVSDSEGNFVEFCVKSVAGGMPEHKEVAV